MPVKKEHLKWNAQMDDAYVQALLNQHHQGFRVDGTFTSTAYSNMIQELKENFGINFTKEHLKNRMKTLKEHFNECYDLFRNGRLSGFAWSPLTRTWSAEPEVWDQLLSEKPNAKKWQNKVFNNFDSLEELFAKDRANGEGAETAKEKRKLWVNQQNEATIENIIDIDDLVSQNEISLEGYDFQTKEGNFEVSEDCEEKTCSEKKTSQGKRKNVANDQELEILKSPLDYVANAIREGNDVFQKSRTRVYSDEAIFNELISIGVEKI